MSNKLRMLAEHLDYSGQRLSTIMRVLSDEYSRLHCDRDSAIEYAVEQCKGECLYCGDKLYKAHNDKFYPMDNLHLDHIYPASYGGLFAKGNVAISCQSCNLSKGARDPIEFYRSKIERGLDCRFSDVKEFEEFLYEYMKPYRDKLTEYYKLHSKIRESNFIEINDIVTKYLLHFDDIRLNKFYSNGTIMPRISYSDDELIYDNTFNCASLSSLTPTSNSIIFAVLLLTQKYGYVDDNDNMSVDVSYKEIREVTGARNMQASDIERILKSLKEIDLKCKPSDDDVKVKSHKLLSEVINVENNLVRIKLSEAVSAKLQTSDSQFTVINVREFSSIKSIYGQELYRLLSQFKGTGKFYIGANQWKMRFDTPKSYSDYDIIRKQIIPAVKNNAPYFENLKVNVKEGDKELPPTIFFTFKPQNIERIETSSKKADDDSALLEYIKAHGGELK